MKHTITLKRPVEAWRVQAYRGNRCPFLCCEFVHEVLKCTPKTIRLTVSDKPFKGSIKALRWQDDHAITTLRYSYIVYSYTYYWLKAKAPRTFYWRIDVPKARKKWKLNRRKPLCRIWPNCDCVVRGTREDCLDMKKAPGVKKSEK